MYQIKCGYVNTISGIRIECSFILWMYSFSVSHPHYIFNTIHSNMYCVCSFGHNTVSSKLPIFNVENSLSIHSQWMLLLFAASELKRVKILYLYTTFIKWLKKPHIAQKYHGFHGIETYHTNDGVCDDLACVWHSVFQTNKHTHTEKF